MFTRGTSIGTAILIFHFSVALSLQLDESFNDTVQFLIKEIVPDNIAKNLRHLTLNQHLGGTEAEWTTGQWVEDLWKDQGLDQVHTVPYDVLLSYPDKERPNLAKIIENDEVIWRSQGKTPPLWTPEESLPDILPDFNAYSPPGNVTAEIVYANFGRESDFDQMPGLGVNVSGKIVIAKYGEVFRANIVKSAEIRGALGVLLYPDPKQYAQEGPERVYPDTVWMPETAAPYGTVKVSDGDPLTPFYPAIESAYRLPVEETELPKIPVMPLSYRDAQEILSKMGGNTAPDDWQGGLNITYKLGPGLSQPRSNEYMYSSDLEQQNVFVESLYQPVSTVNMEVHTDHKRTTVKNVIGVIIGAVEPDRYVVLGNHRDAWIFGAIDPSSGTAVMMELSRTLMQLKNQTGWRPRRSIVFCSWAAEEYGLVGSQEWVEEFGSQLSERAVAYLNLDMAVEGNYSLRAKSIPTLNDVTREIAKMVPNPDPAEVDRGMATVFDTWADREPHSENPGEPNIRMIGSGSDYKPFMHKYGIPCQEYRYTYSKEMYAEPLYHTLYETYDLVAKLYDPGFHFHVAIGQLWGSMAILMADQDILPMSMGEFAIYIDDAQQSIINKTGDLLKGREQAIGYFVNASKQLTEAVQKFDESLSNVNKTDLLAVRRVNDQLMRFDRAFIDRRGLPGRPDFNHVIVAPSSTDSYSGAAFSGLTDALAGIEDLPQKVQEARWRVFDEHLAVCTHILLVAAKTLTEELW